MARLKWRIAMIVPVMLFCVLAVSAYWRGTSSRWEQGCRVLWEKQQWHEIVSFAQNLDRLGHTDAQVTFLAAQAAKQLNDTESARELNASLERYHVLNWSMETTLLQDSAATTRMALLRLYRTRICMALLVLVALFNLAAVSGRPSFLFCSSSLSVIGIVLLLL